ncbi:hypothetical protein R5O20_08545 [Tenacibaculum maritimum]
MSVAMGGDYFSGFAAGAVGSAIGHYAKIGLEKAGANNFWKASGIITAGSLSGGVGSFVSGGKFWDGFRNGAISSALNHVAHMVKDVDPEKIKKRILKDGKLTREEANKWFKYGNGEPLTVDASKIDLDFVRPEMLIKGKYISVQTLYASKDGGVYGHLSLKMIDNNSVIIGRDNYGFEMHKYKGGFFSRVKTFFRNQFTRLGNPGAGKPFDIFFNKYGNINKSYSIPGGSVIIPPSN